MNKRRRLTPVPSAREPLSPRCREPSAPALTVPRALRKLSPPPPQRPSPTRRKPSPRPATLTPHDPTPPRYRSPFTDRDLKEERSLLYKKLRELQKKIVNLLQFLK